MTGFDWLEVKLQAMPKEETKRPASDGITPITATPHSKRQRFDGNSFLSSLNEATTTGGPESPSKDPQVGDALQQKAIALANQGSNLFVTGRAGTGKSWVTKRIIEEFTKRNERIYATAPTGIAAINVDGTTIHNWGRFNLGQYCKLCYMSYIMNMS